MENLFSVKSKIVLVTGASSGIGKYSAITFAKHGANIILIGRNHERLKEVELQCKQFGSKTLIISADISQSSDVAKIVQQSKEHFTHIDVVLNSAGIASRVPPLELTEQQWDDVIDINLKGTFLVAQAIAKWMVESKKGGKIINISSSAAFRPSTTRLVYSASKIAIESITRTMALDLAKDNIQVNCIAPGFFVTELTENYIQTDVGKAEITHVPMQRAANVNEFEGVLLLLASNASSYMTGSVVHIDGGYAVNKV